MYSTAVRMKIRASYKRGQVSRRPLSKKIRVRLVLLTVLAGGGDVSLGPEARCAKGVLENFCHSPVFHTREAKVPGDPVVRKLR